ncbi:hypothetical protein BDM02DRAFT_1972899 [Thelephora ganbajun]|uniref:Uncharacterized protein n=1 Tax=Thelephora ganbajun TaxID=370292 RepID=A0ACB6ZI24_THEGA|nr:hypothetical protein BDM02DRAFT_1972899 [Thelephora ganbajun]
MLLSKSNINLFSIRPVDLNLIPHLFSQDRGFSTTLTLTLQDNTLRCRDTASRMPFARYYYFSDLLSLISFGSPSFRSAFCQMAGEVLRRPLRWCAFDLHSLPSAKTLNAMPPCFTALSLSYFVFWVLPEHQNHYIHRRKVPAAEFRVAHPNPTEWTGS